jgi:hypothetical protein
MLSRVHLLILIALIWGAPVFMHAQGGSISLQVVQPAPPTGTGGPAAFASVRVCPVTGSGTPCSPLSSLFLDPALTISTGNPATTDQYGNTSLWVAPGPVLVQVTPVNGVIYSYLMEAVAGTVTSVTLNMPSTVFNVSSSSCSTVCLINVTFASQSPGLVFGSPLGGPGLPSFRQSNGIDFGSQGPYNVFGNCTGSSTTPAFCNLVANMIPGTLNGTNFNGNVAVAGNLSATGTLGIAGAATLSSSLSVGTSLAVTGTTTLSGSLSAPSFSLGGSQFANGFQGSSGTKIATASGSWSNGILLQSNASSDIASTTIPAAQVPLLNATNTWTNVNAFTAGITGGGVSNTVNLIGWHCPINSTVATTYTVATNDCIIHANASGGSFTITLPHAVTGTYWSITRTDNSANTLTIAGDSGSINGQSTFTLNGNTTTECHADGTNSWCTGGGNSGTTQWGGIASGMCVSSGSPCTNTLTWPSPFADATYRVVCFPLGPPTGNPQAAFMYLSGQTAATITLTTDNRGTANPGGFTAVSCIGNHM